MKWRVMKDREYHVFLYVCGFLLGLGVGCLVNGWTFWGVLEAFSQVTEVSFFYPLLMLLLGVVFFMLGLLLPFTIQRREKHEKRK